MRRVILAVVILVAVCVGGVFLWHWWTVGRFVESTDNAYVRGDISVVSPRIQGYVRTIAVEDNQEVAAGDVLAVIEDTDYAAKLADAKAMLAVAEAAIGSSDAKTVLQRSMIEQAKASVALAEAEDARALKDFERYRDLLAKTSVSHQQFDTAEADHRKAAASLTKARAALVTEQDQLDVVAASRKEAQAKLAQAQADLALAQSDLDNTVIKAPVAGVIGNRAVQLGQYVKPGTMLLSVVPLPRIYVVANFKETQLARMRRGQPVDISVDAFPGETLAGAVESFSPASGALFSLLPPENATGNFTKIVQRVPVRIAIAPGSALAALLRPGLSVTAAVDTRNIDAAPRIAGASPAPGAR